MSTRSREDEINFIGKAKDGVYKATEIVREEATAVEHTAQQVEKLSKSIEDDVDNVESLIHQVITTTNSKEEKGTEVEVNSNGSSSKAPDQIGNVLAKGALAVNWPETASHIIFIILTLFAVLLHNNWGSSILGKNTVELDDSTTLPTSKNYTFFGILLVYMGTIWRALKFVRNVMNWQKSTVVKVEEKVHEIGKEVKSVVNNIEEVADTVEHISQHIEEEASQIQSFINPVKST